jgi:hypothetical protein
MALSPKFIKLKSELLNLASLLPYEPLPPTPLEPSNDPLLAPTAAGGPSSTTSANGGVGSETAATVTSSSTTALAAAEGGGAVSSAMEVENTSISSSSSISANPYSWSAQGIEVARYDHPAWAETVRAAQVNDSVYIRDTLLPTLKSSFEGVYAKYKSRKRAYLTLFFSICSCAFTQDPRALLDCIFALEIALPSSWLAHW